MFTGRSETWLYAFVYIINFLAINVLICTEGTGIVILLCLIIPNPQLGDFKSIA